MGLFIDVCGMFVGCLWMVCGMIQAGGRKETPRTADVTVTKIASYVRVHILVNRCFFFSNFWDSYFSSYGEFGEFSLRFTAAL